MGRATVKKGDTITLDYTLRLENGTIIGSTINCDPVEIVVGDGEIIAGIEKAVIGMKEGDQQTLALDYNDAFGPYQRELIQEIEKSCIPNTSKLSPGQIIELKSEDDEPITATIVEIKDQTITVDANHQLAGKNIVVDLRIIEIL